MQRKMEARDENPIIKIYATGDKPYVNGKTTRSNNGNPGEFSSRAALAKTNGRLVSVFHLPLFPRA